MKDNYYTLRGRGLAGDVDRLTLFDGKFTTGYRLIDFQITPENILDAERVSCKLMTELKDHNVNWFWRDNREIGWAAWNVPTNSRFGPYSQVDQNTLIIEDLFMDFSGDSGEYINYYVVLEKLKLDKEGYQAALALVRNNSQDID
jgi:hypothetical protein|tara:strand:- start:338 stop:772 length:435 start_codon:yes stop_codon:yes gene_type:complete